MKVIVNGKEKTLKNDATLKDAVLGEHYVKGTLISIHLSTEKLVRESEDFEIVTSAGDMVIHLDDSDDARRWKDSIKGMIGLTARWVTHNVASFGTFVSDIEGSREERMYARYDCFFSLGGFDNHTTYMMIARDNHRWSYGAGVGRIGHITRGRHIMDMLREGDEISEIRPVVSEIDTENVIVTSDLGRKLEDGYRVDTHVMIDLNESAPVSAEHLMILSSKGYMNISDATGSYAACSDDRDVTIPDEPNAVRDLGSVTVRKQGEGIGRVFFYKDRRQLSTAHNDAGRISNGFAIASMAKTGDKISVLTNPVRVLSVGMTQAEGKKMLESFGIKQKRTGEISDDAIIAEQMPEITIDVLKTKEVETFGITKSRLFKVKLDRKKSPATIHYFEKVTGLSHKPIGLLTVHFTFAGLPMVTFEADETRGHTLYPNEPFRKCKRGDIGVTNQARPNCGLIGIRLEESKEYGPTGEEGYGTNIFGRFDDDLDKLMKDLKDGDVIYVTEGKL